jgi:zinc transport system substrate-binding protein
LPPVAWLAAQIGGDKVDVVQILPDGKNPHDYAPGAGELTKAARAKVYLSAGTNFDLLASKPFSRDNRILDLNRNTERISMTTGENCGKSECGHHHHHAECNDHSVDGSDPHIWLSIHNNLIMAKDICAEFSRLSPADAEYFQNNLKAVSDKFTALEKDIKDELSPYKGRAFFVYHPAFGYYAHMTGLKQIGIELGGREASPARLAEVIKHAKADKAAVIFVQPQFNPASAKALAKETGAEVSELDPLAKDVIANIQHLTATLKKGFSAEGVRD